MQNSILIVIDLEATLAERSIENNVYLVDNTKSIGSENVGQADLVTIIRGTSNLDGGIADAVVMNWLATGISSAPHTLPKAYFSTDFDASRYKDLLDDIRSADTLESVASLAASHEKELPGGGVTSVLASNGRRLEVETVPTDATGRALGTEEQLSSAALSPVVIDIKGPAVKNGVIFPAQYGSPDLSTEGWYWSASVDTRKVGEHVYTVVVMIYRPEREGDNVLWKPEYYSFDARIRVTDDVTVNGFTGYGPGILPLIPAPLVAPHDAAPDAEPETSPAHGDIL